MAIVAPDNARGPIIQLELPASAKAREIVLRNVTTGKTLTINIPNPWAGDDLTLNWFRRTITDQTGADRSALLDPEDNALWVTSTPLIAGSNVLRIGAFDVSGVLIESKKSAGEVVNSNLVGTIPWVTPANAKVSDNTRATAALTAGQKTNYLLATKFGFTGLPKGGRIVTLSAESEVSSVSGFVSDFDVRMIYGGVPVGANRAAVGSWLSGIDGANSANVLADFPGFTEDLEKTDTGFAIAAQAIGGSDTARVDLLSMKVGYQLPQEYGAKASVHWEQGYY